MILKWKCVDLQTPIIYSSNLRNWSNITPRSLTFDDLAIALSSTLTDKPLKSCFACGNLNTINSDFFLHSAQPATFAPCDSLQGTHVATYRWSRIKTGYIHFSNC